MVKTKSSGAVIEGLDSKDPRSFHESVKISFKNPSAECSRVGGPSNVTKELVCIIRVAFAHLIQHNQESPCRNRLYETADQRPRLGRRRRRAYLECAMDRVTTPRVEDNIRQVLDISNPILDPICDIKKSSRRYCRFETSTRYVPTNTGSFLKSLESDVGLVQE